MCWNKNLKSTELVNATCGCVRCCVTGHGNMSMSDENYL